MNSINASLLRTETGRREFIAGAAKTFLGVTALGHVGGKALAVPGENTSPLKQVPTARNVIYLLHDGWHESLGHVGSEEGQ